jgi:hypothetical protein
MLSIKCRSVLLGTPFLIQLALGSFLSASQPQLSLPSTKPAPTLTAAHLDLRAGHSIVQPTATTTNTSTSAAPTSLHLLVTSNPPDPLGIAKVSGLYGPGGWAAWFLLGLASWLRILRKDDDWFDLNTWLFLLFTNWAAIDVFRGIHALRSVPGPMGTETMVAAAISKMGALGAALSIVFWGVFHVILQFAATWVMFRDEENQSKRFWTLLLGMVLPGASLLTAGLLLYTLLGEVIISQLPTMYWDGIAIHNHELLITMVMPFSGFLCLVLLYVIPYWF